MKKMTKILVSTLVICLVVGAVFSFSVTASAAPSVSTNRYDVDGDGTADSVYEIRTVDDFLWYLDLAATDRSARPNGILMNDLDLSSVCSETLGNWQPKSGLYLGVFDGNGYTVKNLYINNPSNDYQALFGSVISGEVKNLSVTGTVIGKRYVSGIVAYNSSKITNCKNYVNVTADSTAGGIAGYFGSSEIKNCVNYGKISSSSTNTANIGGISGNCYGKVINCVNLGEFSAPQAWVVGGISGDAYSVETLFENCINVGNLSGKRSVSEIVYGADVVKNCYYRSNTGNPAVYNSRNTDIENVSALATDKFTSGELAYRLGDGWGQNIGVDNAPVPGGPKVYYTNDPNTLCSASSYIYSNTEYAGKHDTSLSDEAFDEDDVCIYCGYYRNNNGEHSYSSPCDTTCDHCSITREASCRYETAVASGNKLTVTCKYCGDEEGTLTITAAGGKYNGKAYSASVTAQNTTASYNILYGSVLNSAVSDKAPVVPGIYLAYVEFNGVRASIEYTIEKGDIEYSKPPEMNYIYGTPNEDIVLEGEAVIKGTNTVIDGTWVSEWAGMYLVYRFVPSGDAANYFNQAEAVAPTRNVTPATPVLTLESPSPAAMPGMSIQLSLDVKHPFSTTSGLILPDEFEITYRIGASGTPVTVDSLTITIPSNAVIGETLYVTASNDAFGNYYTKSTSNQIEIKIGQVDYSSEIEDLQEQLDRAVEDLEAKIFSGQSNLTAEINAVKNSITALQSAKADAAALTEAVNGINKAIEALEAAYATADDLLKNELSDAISTAKEEAIKTASEALTAAKNELNEKIDTKASATELTKAVEDLNHAISLAETTAKKFATDSDTELKEQLDEAISDAKAEAIEKADNALTAAKNELNEKIKSGDEALAKSIETLSAALNAAKQALEAADLELAEADRANKEELENKIASAKKELTEAINDVIERLKNTEKSLREAIDRGDSVLESEIYELGLALEEAVKAYQSADESIKSDLENQLEEAYDAQDLALRELQRQLSQVNNELKTRDRELAATDAMLRTVIIVVATVSGVTLAGVSAFVIWFFVDRKKKLDTNK